jgi:hypothetical protein
VKRTLSIRRTGIELYLGVDVLADNGVLEPVRWSAGPAGQPPQGSLVNKKKVQNRYRDKVKQTRADPSAVARLDWDGMQAIIETILQAVNSAT